ncbi:MAG: hypothetical protein KatS3mg102_2917 [Planctomycetota bacterium]|nr:MAG: hypothetical protein KatS3mg102_2917 [Planctomycetota bacterium]
MSWTRQERAALLEAAPWLLGWDARARLVALGGLALALASVRTLAAAGAGTALAAVLLLLARVPAAQAWRRLRWLGVVILPIAVLVPLRDPGLALLLSLRVAAAGTAAVLALGVGPFDRTARGLQGLGVPARLVHMALLAYRYLFVLGEHLDRVRVALVSRGFVPRFDRHTAAVYGRVTGALLVRSVARTERVDQAMRCRGFAGRLRSRSPARLSRSDLMRAAAVLGVAAWVLVLDRLQG